MQGLSKFIIRPFREAYDPVRDLGPKDFILQGKVFTREDFTLRNSRGYRLECSWFQPKFTENSKLDCIIYCHGNCGSRCDSLEIANALLLHDISVFAFDFSGSGLSEGKFVSLGYYESWDLKCVVDYLRSTNKVNSLGIWGRSMGASSAILYASCDPYISLLVLDSPFVSLKKTSCELFSSLKIFPESFFKSMFKYTRKIIQATANFDIEEVTPVKYVSQCRMPAVFLHGRFDKLVSFSQGKELYDRYCGDKYLLELGGGHNSPRPPVIIERVLDIILDVLHNPEEVLDDGMQTNRGVLPSISKGFFFQRS